MLLYGVELDGLAVVFNQRNWQHALFVLISCYTSLGDFYQHKNIWLIVLQMSFEQFYIDTRVSTRVISVMLLHYF